MPLKDFEVESWLRTVDARIIAMGEPNHGSRQPRQIQTEVILAAHALFPRLVLFGEWCDSEGRELNAYIHGHNSGEAPPKIAGPIIWSGTWEVAWRRLRMSERSHEVGIYGMRACQPDGHRAEIQRLLTGISAETEARIQTALHGEAADVQAFSEQMELIRGSLSSDDVPARQACEILYQLQLLAQARRRLEDPLYQADSAMAANVTYVLDCLEPDSRAIILAHNGHIAKTERMLLPNGRRQPVVLLGTALASNFGDDYIAVGSLAGDGEFCAVPLLRPRARRTRAYRLEHPRGAVEEHLFRGPPTPSSWFVDLHSLRRGAFPSSSFMAGYGYSWGWPLSWMRAVEYREIDIQRDFDGLFYWRTVEPDQLPGCGPPNGSANHAPTAFP